MSTLKNAFKPTTSKSTSSKNPTYYNNEKNLCITDMATHENAIIRSAIAENSHTPTKVLEGMLAVEQDKSVLRKVLFSKVSRKAVAKFVNDVNDERVEWFSDDEELIEHFQQ